MVEPSFGLGNKFFRTGLSPRKENMGPRKDRERQAKGPFPGTICLCPIHAVSSSLRVFHSAFLFCFLFSFGAPSREVVQAWQQIQQQLRQMLPRYSGRLSFASRSRARDFGTGGGGSACGRIHGLWPYAGGPPVFGILVAYVFSGPWLCLRLWSLRL